jgi:hypothetical protein
MEDAAVEVRPASAMDFARTAAHLLCERRGAGLRFTIERSHLVHSFSMRAALLVLGTDETLLVELSC